MGDPLRVHLTPAMHQALLAAYDAGGAGQRCFAPIRSLWALARRGLCRTSGRRVWLTAEGRIRGRTLSLGRALHRAHIVWLLAEA